MRSHDKYNLVFCLHVYGGMCMHTHTCECACPHPPVVPSNTSRGPGETDKSAEGY